MRSRPFPEELSEILVYPVKDGGWVALLACTLLILAGTLAFGLGFVSGDGVRLALGLVAHGVLITFVFAFHVLILRRAAQGSRGVPRLPEIDAAWRELIRPGLHGALVTLAIFLGPALWHATRVIPLEAEVRERHGAASRATEEREFLEGGARHATRGTSGALDALIAHERTVRRDLERAKSHLAGSRMAGLALLLAASAIWPLPLMAVALADRVPRGTVSRIVKRAPRDYAFCVAFVAACALGARLVWPACYFSFIAFHVMGRTAGAAVQGREGS